MARFYLHLNGKADRICLWSGYGMWEDEEIRMALKFGPEQLEAWNSTIKMWKMVEEIDKNKNLFWNMLHLRCY